jgi:hypothetical protein
VKVFNFDHQYSAHRRRRARRRRRTKMQGRWVPAGAVRTLYYSTCSMTGIPYCFQRREMLARLMRYVSLSILLPLAFVMCCLHQLSVHVLQCRMVGRIQTRDLRR